MKIGLYFGSFNPVHIGHLIVASYAKHTTDLQQVWLMVTPQNPFKPSNSLLNEYHRLHLVRLAIGEDTNLRVSDIEFGLPKPSYTANTLAYLKEKYPQHEFAVIMGSDSFANLPKWHNHKYILENHHIYVFMRNGFAITDNYGARYTVIEAPLVNLSSTEIRRFIRQRIPIRYMVPDAAAKEIEDCNYYK